MVSPIPAEVVLARLTPEVRGWLHELRIALPDLLGERLADLRLFGSQARGDTHEESDIDVLILVHDLDWDTWVAVTDLTRSISQWFSPSVNDYERYHAPFSRAGGFYKELRKDSVKLL